MALSAGATVLTVPKVSPLTSIPCINSSSASDGNTTTVAVSALVSAPGLLVLFRLAFLSLIAGYFVWRCIKYFTSDLPPFGSGLKRLPGPISTLPYLGRIHDVDRFQPWTAMKKFSDRYNGLFSCTLGGETHIWVAREDVAQDLLCNNAAISSSRANLGAYPDVIEGMKYVPLIGFTEHHFRQRKFTNLVMKRNANRNFQNIFTLEAKRTLYELLSKPEDFYDLLYLFCGRNSTRLAYGEEALDSVREHIVNSAIFIRQLGPNGPVTNLAPFLGRFPEWLVPGIREVRERQEREERVWTRLYKEAKERIQEEKRSRASTYVSTSLETREGGGEKDKLLVEEEEAKWVVGMLCIVAIFTVQGPAVLFLLAMVLHPEWQDRVRQEIDEALGEEEIVDVGRHFALLPTLHAAILECVRWKSTVPLGVPRQLATSYSYDGYHFPKDSIVHILDIALAQDPAHYISPETYNPGRWLDPSSPNFKAPLTEHPRLKGHHIFGRGKRMCPGQEMAEAELFVICGNIVKFFMLEPKVDEKGEKVWPDENRRVSDVIGGPLPFECVIRVRSERHRGTVESMYEEAFPAAAASVAVGES